jgi:hypothetical protein
MDPMTTTIPPDVPQDDEISAMARHAGLLAEGETLSAEVRDFANLIAHSCADIADRRDPSERPGAAIRRAFGLKERRAVGRPPRTKK